MFELLAPPEEQQLASSGARKRRTEGPNVVTDDGASFRIHRFRHRTHFVSGATDGLAGGKEGAGLRRLYDRPALPGIHFSF
jgi:hypothetical protein